ncbi:ribosome biogenesis protein SLX9 homolog isoform 1-T1 [Molossus nigricans]|uniref:Family with sequence similarity 207 member A n=1 Tax=Molossus molossus TaxID=27622 RepID=A0A7J8HZR5_MOLMO|nr:protein FAM207A isoform X1 [Molossus molossus]KAF6477510.1 family with sequence similarity 207 member A [Molossus molossus]
MGKVRGLRARVHQAAVRLTGESAPGLAPQAQEAAPPQASAGGVGRKEWAFVNTDIFARTKIDPSTLVQKLDLDTRSVTSIRRGAEAKTILPKKEKLKLRRERWLQKIEAIKLAEQKHKAEKRRRATVVVGDLQPLRDALPELLELEAGTRQPHTRGRTSSKPRPAELSRMSATQRLQLLEEERTRFRDLLANPAYRASPLLAIGQQLARQMQLDGGGLL